jgi:large subunit ribosomal protein L9
VKIKLHSDVTVEISFDVVSENPIEPVVQEAPASDRKEWKKPARRDSKE